jgi:hypothetical protein
MIERESSGLQFAVENFSYFNNSIHLAGWAFCQNRPIEALHLLVKNRDPVEIRSYGLSSPDVAAKGFGPAAQAVRFDEFITTAASSEEIVGSKLKVIFAEGEPGVIGGLGNPSSEETHAIFSRFLHLIQQRPPGRFLEIGSRARSGITRRDLLPAAWHYTGLDVLEGPNVDVAGDAHELSRIFPSRKFDAVMALSVLEHLIMPWKFIIELNKVMSSGAIGLFITPQAWPMHDEPWDFFRFSKHAFQGLLNPATGFRILESEMGEPCSMVARKLHSTINFAPFHVGFLMTVVSFEKIGDTALSWPVSVPDVTSTAYPPGESEWTA